MSAFRALSAPRIAPLSMPRIAQRAGFHGSLTRAAGKESTLHQEGRADEVEEKKQDMLKKQKEGKGHWEEGLASDSESIVKADRGEAKSTQEHIEKLQKEGAKVGQK